MLVRAPIRIQFTSPRATVWNQKETSSPSSTSPVTYAPGATNTRTPSRGSLPSKGTSGILFPRGPPADREKDLLIGRQELLELRARRGAQEVDAAILQGKLEHQRAARLVALAAVHADEHA